MQIRYLIVCEPVDVKVGLVSPLNGVSPRNEKVWEQCVSRNKLLWNETFHLGESCQTQFVTPFYFTLRRNSVVVLKNLVLKLLVNFFCQGNLR